MKINELLYQTPEMTEEKLLEIIKKELIRLRLIRKDLIPRLEQIHGIAPIENILLKEFDLIQEKKSYLSKSERDTVLGFVGACMIKMTKQEDKEYVDYEEVTDGRESGDLENPVSETTSVGYVESI